MFSVYDGPNARCILLSKQPAVLVALRDVLGQNKAELVQVSDYPALDRALAANPGINIVMIDLDSYNSVIAQVDALSRLRFTHRDRPTILLSGDFETNPFAPMSIARQTKSESLVPEKRTTEPLGTASITCLTERRPCIPGIVMSSRTRDLVLPRRTQWTECLVKRLAEADPEPPVFQQRGAQAFGDHAMIIRDEHVNVVRCREWKGPS